VSDEGEISVFLCDDSSSLRKLVRLQLEDYPHLLFVGEAAGSGDCERGVADLVPDIVLIDHGVVAGRDPGAFLTRLRGAAPDALLVLFSGLTADLLTRDSQTWGADGFIHKDASAAELARTLTDLAGAQPPPRLAR
jgi:DNA-binding NarL/FixJ family response regulator